MWRIAPPIPPCGGLPAAELTSSAIITHWIPQPPHLRLRAASLPWLERGRLRMIRGLARDEEREEGGSRRDRAGAFPVSAEIDLSIIIVAWNVRDLVLDCLASIEVADLQLRYEVIVVDNGSEDGTVRSVQAQFPNVHVIALPENIGFGAGNNQGLLKMNGRHALLLNSDTIVLPGGLERCVSYLDEHPDVGVVGPQLLNPDRTKQNCIHNAPTLIS